MSKKEIIILVILGLVIGLGIIFGFFNKPGEQPSSVGVQNGKSGLVVENGETIFDPKVPERAAPTAPVISAPAAPDREEKFGIFEIKVSATGFQPKSITVKKGDVIQIKLTAEGGDYDFSMPYSGLYAAVKKDETKQITFGANTAGTYTFMCRDFCPLLKTIEGSVIVLP